MPLSVREGLPCEYPASLHTLAPSLSVPHPGPSKLICTNSAVALVSPFHAGLFHGKVCAAGASNQGSQPAGSVAGTPSQPSVTHGWMYMSKLRRVQSVPGVSHADSGSF